TAHSRAERIILEAIGGSRRQAAII
ncbi:hypothetical protein CCACVL1_10603, partial [Corchorus capsularis]